jgi:hypothetical protein
MPITNPTEWRWPDSTFGPQNKVPFNDNQQYPDCGPSSRSYVSEDILYGLENVITPLLQSLVGGANIRETSGSATCTASFAALGSADCSKVTFYTLSTDANVEVTLNSGSTIVLEKGYSMEVITDNLARIEIRQTGGEADVVYFKYLPRT